MDGSTARNICFFGDLTAAVGYSGIAWYEFGSSNEPVFLVTISKYSI
jgi:hypothetical protein